MSQELSQISLGDIDLVLGILGEFREDTESACPYKTQILFQIQWFGLKPREVEKWRTHKISKVYRVS